MISIEKRNEAWEKNKQYMTTEHEKRETICDLLPLCMKCNKFKNLKNHDFNKCRGEACMELWLSNEYQEWSNIYN
jgi:hypothetical protein